MMKEDGADSRVKFHLSMWNTLSHKTLNLNLPDVSKMENLKEIRNKLNPSSREFQKAFLGLNAERYDRF